MDEKFYISDYYKAIGEAIIDRLPEFRAIKECNTRICYMTSTREKKSKGHRTFADCRKVHPRNQVWCPFDFIITVYLPNVENLKETNAAIVIAHELLHIDAMLTDAGPVFGIRPHDFADFEWIVARYGLWWAQPGLSEEETNELAEATAGALEGQISIFE